MARAGAVWLMLVFGIAGCSGPVASYHSIEGGAIAQRRAPPPGADLPYPNLANVPAAPVALTPAQTQSVTQRLNPAAAGVPATEASQAALAGLVLPAGPPPPPDVPGLNIPAAPSPAPAPAAQVGPVAAAPKPPDGVPVALAFRPGSAIVDSSTITALTKVAQGRGEAMVLAGGFGEQVQAPDAAALTLALNRARAIADALTAAGVPPNAITLNAATPGYGGFVQLVY